MVIIIIIQMVIMPVNTGNICHEVAPKNRNQNSLILNLYTTLM